MKREFIVIDFDEYSDSCNVSKNVILDYMSRNKMSCYANNLYYSDTLNPVEVLVLFQNMLKQIHRKVFQDINGARLLRCFEDDDLSGFIK